MNRRPSQTSNKKFPGVKGIIMRALNLTAAAKTRLVVAGTIGILCGCNVLDAASLPANNATNVFRDKDGFIIDFAAAPVSKNAASKKPARKTNAAPAKIAPVANAVSNNQAATPPATALSPDTTNAANVLDDKYRLATGDQLSFQIIEDGDAPVHLVVTDSGDLQIPYIGRYPAVGKTCKQLAQELKADLEKEYYKQATVVVAVDLKPESRGKIYLVGAIRTPGPEDISSDEVLTVSKAILRAGGFTDYADEKNVKVTRSTGTGTGGEKTFIVNVEQILENGKTGNDMPVQPGDLVFVPERMIRF
jgi:protein involved in polysaccharide export with SLBB domain